MVSRLPLTTLVSCVCVHRLWPNNNCIEVMDAINSQMNKWHNLTDVACGSSEKCGYKVSFRQLTSSDIIANIILHHIA